jgi:hypothetical protein
MVPRPPQPPTELPTIHYTELPEARPDHLLGTEWNFYRGQVGDFLAKGLEGRWVIIKGEEIIGIWDTKQEAEAVRTQRFPSQKVLMRQILEREPILRGGGYDRRWRS